MTISLQLTQGQVALIDDEDAHLAEHKWRAIWGYGTWCAGRMDGYQHILLHRAVMQYDGPLDVHHRDHDGLNCRRKNLDIVTRRYNILHRRKRAMCNVTTRILSDGSMRYDARMTCYGVTVFLGSSRSAWVAAELVRINLERIIIGLPLIAIKRPHRWAPLERVEITYD